MKISENFREIRIISNFWIHIKIAYLQRLGKYSFLLDFIMSKNPFDKGNQVQLTYLLANPLFSGPFCTKHDFKDDFQGNQVH